MIQINKGREHLIEAKRGRLRERDAERENGHERKRKRNIERRRIDRIEVKSIAKKV